MCQTFFGTFLCSVICSMLFFKAGNSFLFTFTADSCNRLSQICCILELESRFSRHYIAPWNSRGNTHTHTRLTALFPGLPRWAGTRNGKPIWILLKHETVSGSGISWAMCKSAPRSRQITTPAPHRSVFYRPDALPAAQPTVSKHWRQNTIIHTHTHLMALFPGEPVPER